MNVFGQSGRLAPCAFVFFLTIGQAAAEYRFDSWTTESGLPHNTVNVLLQSRQGYLWVGTPDGLARFDGVRFTVFNKVNSPGLSSNRIRALYEDGDGDLWIGSQDGRLIRYHQGSFTTFGPQHGLPDRSVISVTGDDRGSLWVFQRNGLLRWQGNGFVRDMPDVPAFESPQPIGWNRSGLVWRTNESGLHIYLRGKLTTLNLSNGLPASLITKVDEDQYGNLWVATEDAGLVKVQNGKAVKVHTERDGLPTNRVQLLFAAQTMVCEDKKGNIWVNGAGPWLGRLKDGVFTAYPSASTLSSHPLPEAAGLPGGRINALLEDSEGNLWIGTEGSGLIRAREQVVNVLSTRNGLHAGNIYPIYEDPSGAVWVGTWDKGLARVEAGQVTNFPVDAPFSLVTSICEDRSRRFFWMGTYGGLVIFQNGVPTRTGVPSRFANEMVSTILQDATGTWFGSESGLFRYENGELTCFTSRDGLSGDRVSVIIKDRAGALWIGTRGGLTRLVNGHFTAWTEKDGLPSNHVRALYEDAEGTLWIGTMDGGLGRFKEGHFASYTTKDGMFDNGVFQILEDASGNFWMSSNRGIHRVNKRHLNEFAEGRRRSIPSIAYGKSDGMLNPECNGGCWPAGIKRRDGKFWFPTQDGVAIIDPDAVPTNTNPPPVVIESVLLDRALAATPRESGADVPGKNGGALTKRRYTHRPLRVPPDSSNIEIQYSALSFINSERLQFKYRLTGWDQDWVEAGTRRTAYYSHVAPGHYTFHVLAANSDGVWNMNGASLALIVLPAWYETWWFRALVFVALAGGALGVFRWRVDAIERRRAAQEAFSRELLQQQEAERKRIAAELHDSLGQNLLVIKNRAVLAKNPGAPAVQEFDEIARLATRSIEEVREISQNLRPYQLDRLGLTRALHSLVKKVGESSKLKCTADITPVDRVFPSDDETNLFRIAQEALNNVLKHSGATEARVVVERDDTHVRLLIEDNGRGFDWASKQRDGAHGMGLNGIAERARILRGRLEVHSTPGHGTRLKIEAPIPKDRT